MATTVTLIQPNYNKLWDSEKSDEEKRSASFLVMSKGEYHPELVEYEETYSGEMSGQQVEEFGSDLAICEMMFHQFNCPEEVAYSEAVCGVPHYGGKQQMRSLSVGDIVVVNGTRYVCASVGFQKMEEAA